MSRDDENTLSDTDAAVRDGAQAILGTRIPALPDEVAQFCRRWRVRQMALFGSVLREDFGPHSDIGVLVSFAPGPTPGLFGLVRMERDLAELFGRPVDVRTRRAVRDSRNRIRRRRILDAARVIHEA